MISYSVIIIELLSFLSRFAVLDVQLGSFLSQQCFKAYAPMSLQFGGSGSPIGRRLAGRLAGSLQSKNDLIRPIASRAKT